MRALSDMAEQMGLEACDFQILCIEDYIWRGDVEYMFFRNSYPTVGKLRSGILLCQLESYNF